MYLDFQSIPKVYNIQLTVENITKYNNTYTYYYDDDYYWTSTNYGDEIVYKVEAKLPGDSGYKTFRSFASDYINQFASLIDKYQYLLGFNSSDLQDSISGMPTTVEFPQFWSLKGTDYYYYNFNYLTICVPLSFSLKDYFNISALSDPDNLASFNEEFGTDVKTSDELLSALGVSNFQLNDKNYFAVFNLQSVDQKVLDGYTEQLNITGVNTYAQLLDYLNISSPNIYAKEALVYNDKGVLVNVHHEMSVSGSYTTLNDTKAAVSAGITFDVSSGEHPTINSNWVDLTKPKIPGYSMLYLGVAFLIGLCAIILKIHRKIRK
ncbi:MAG: hypothetical protein ACTSU2_10705 [Promethearchaeota archaeon]